MIRQAGIITVFLIPLLAAAPALADREQGGLSYTTRGGTPVQSTANTQMRSIKYTPQEAPAAAAEGTEEGAEDDTPASRVWKKYKNLASGTEGQTAPEKESEDPAAAENEETAPEEERPTGFAAILQEYKKNKQSRSEMKTIVISKPEKPEAPKEPEKPEVKKPAAD